MADIEPGDRPGPLEAPRGRRLEQAPGARYRGAEPGAAPGVASGGAAVGDVGSALPGPLARALAVAVAGAGALVVVGAILASTAGLLFVSGALGGGVGLVLARAAVPRGDARPVARRTVTWLAVAVSIGAVLVADVATWLVALGEGGTLGLPEYLWTTFELIIPGEFVVVALAAAWGAGAGPVQG